MNSLNLVATTNAIELISMDFAKLDIRKAMYRWVQVEAILRIPKLPLLDHLNYIDHILSIEELLKIDTNKDKLFRDLDKAGCVCSLGPPMSPLHESGVEFSEVPFVQ